MLCLVDTKRCLLYFIVSLCAMGIFVGVATHQAYLGTINLNNGSGGGQTGNEAEAQADNHHQQQRQQRQLLLPPPPQRPVQYHQQTTQQQRAAVESILKQQDAIAKIMVLQHHQQGSSHQQHPQQVPLSLPIIASGSSSSSSATTDSSGNNQEQETTKVNTKKKKRKKKKQRKRTATKRKESSNNQQPKRFDFVVAGFPKCGSTTLLYAFESHEETFMAPREQCNMTGNMVSEWGANQALRKTVWLALEQHQLQQQSGTSNKKKKKKLKLGMKCPSIVNYYNSMTRIVRHSPLARFIVGVRHPISMLQSYYNYRVTEVYDNIERRRRLKRQQQQQQQEQEQQQEQQEQQQEEEEKEYIPSFDAIINGTVPKWKGVFRNLTIFEESLLPIAQQGNMTQYNGDATTTTTDDHNDDSRVRVFLYSLDQMKDSNASRSEDFRKRLQEFMGLSSPIPPFGHENRNNYVGTTAHEETMDICQEKYEPLRREMIAEGRRTAQWMMRHVLLPPNQDVFVVANREHFAQTLGTWGTDPCTSTRT